MSESKRSEPNSQFEAQTDCKVYTFLANSLHGSWKWIKKKWSSTGQLTQWSFVLQFPPCMRHTHTTIGLQTFLAAMLALPMDPVVHLCQGGELDLTWGRHVIWEPYRYPILGLPRFGMLRGVPVELDIVVNCIRLRSQQPAPSSLELQPAAHVGQWPGEQAAGEGAAVPAVPAVPPQQKPPAEAPGHVPAVSATLHIPAVFAVPVPVPAMHVSATRPPAVPPVPPATGPPAGRPPARTLASKQMPVDLTGLRRVLRPAQDVRPRPTIMPAVRLEGVVRPPGWMLGLQHVPRPPVREGQMGCRSRHVVDLDEEVVIPSETSRLTSSGTSRSTP